MKWIMSLALICVAGLAWTDDLTPNQIVENTAMTVARRIDGRQDDLAANPQALYTLVNEVFLPVFDTDYAGRLVLGKHWRTTTPDQRRRFIDTFYDFLLRSYAKAVLKFKENNITILPQLSGVPQDPERMIVRTEMRLNDGTMLPVNYSMHMTKDGWRAYDVRIEGISYVQNYRNQFNAEIGVNGIEVVIARLQAETARLAESVKSNAKTSAAKAK